MASPIFSGESFVMVSMGPLPVCGWFARRAVLGLAIATSAPWLQKTEIVVVKSSRAKKRRINIRMERVRSAILM